MRSNAIKFAIAVLFASAASGRLSGEEILDRVFHFTHTETGQDVQEIATVIRGMTEIQQASADDAQRSLTVRGTAGQVAFAEWLFYELDKPTNPQTLAQPRPQAATREYRLSNNGDEVVRVFYLTQTKTPQDLQEVATLVRSMAEIRRLFT